ncbi:MAG: hypothetical protein U0Q55_04370 [Vicinamibacterales bacterium]
MAYLLATGWPGPDDPQHLERQRVLLLGDHLERAVFRGAQRVLAALEHGKTAVTTLQAVFARGVAGALVAVCGRGGSPLAERLDDLNPLALLSAARKVTLCGPGGVSPDGLNRERRDVHASHLGRLCPIETPESERLGLTLFLSTQARIDEHGAIVTPLRASDGCSTELVAPGSEDAVGVSGARMLPAILALTAGQTDVEPVPSRPLDVQHDERPLVRLPTTGAHFQERIGRLESGRAPSLSWTGQSLGVAASLIPFVAHNDGARAMMGAKNMKQAMPVVSPDVPAVQTGFERFVPGAVGQVVRSTVSGMVTAVRTQPGANVSVAGADGREHSHTAHEGRPGHAGGFSAFTPRVSPLDAVDSGAVLAEGPGSLHGTLALGRNLLVAYLPWYGFNFEDGIVVSASAASALTARHAKRIVVEVWPGPRIRPLGPSATDGGISLDAHGVVRPGTVVSVGTTLVRIGGRSVVAWQGIRGRVERVTKRRLVAGGTPSPRYPIEVLVIDLVHEAPLAVGDKLMGRHGNKGVVTLIVPDEEMPRLEDGTPLQVLLNPHGVVGRMNLGQLLETHLGLLSWAARRKGRDLSFVVPPFVGVDEAWLERELSEAGYPSGKARLTNPVTGATLGAPVTVGLQYILRLNHNAADKVAWRTTGPRNSVTGQATRGRTREGGQRFGEMEGWALLAHGAPSLLREMTAKADGAVDGARWPMSVDAALAHARALGLSVTVRSGQKAWRIDEPTAIERLSKGKAQIEVRPATPAEVRLGSFGAVSVRRAFAARATSVWYRCTTSECPAELDADQFRVLDAIVRERMRLGEIRTKRVPCPLGCGGALRRRQGDARMVPQAGGLYDPAIFGDLDTADYRTRHGHIDLAMPLVHPWVYRAGGRPLVQAWRAAGRTPRELDALLKGGAIEGKVGVEALQAVLQESFLATWVVSVVSVLPAAYRSGRDRTRIEPGAVAERYDALLAANQGAAPATSSHGTTFARLQEALESLFGWGRRQPGSLAARLSGKEGFLRQAVLAKRVDFSARAVIVPEPTGELDAVGLPRAMFDAYASALPNFARDPVVLLNRAPTLHRYGIRAGLAYPHDRGDVVLIHPLTCGPMNADFDGDTIGVHVPVDPPARREAHTLLPSRQTHSVANGGHLMHLAQDILSGLFLAAQADSLDRSFAENTKGAVARSLPGAGADRTVHVTTACRLARTGFAAATEAGLTIALADVVRPDRRAWQDVTAALSRRRSDAKKLWTAFAKLHPLPPESEDGGPNPLAAIIASGGRGDPLQVGQIRTARGLVTGSAGLPLPHVIEASYRDGLPELEYFYAAHATRKAMGDKKLITGPAGELTRWLVEAAYECLIVSKTCAPSGRKADGLPYRISTVAQAVVDLEGRVLASAVVAGRKRLAAGAMLSAKDVARMRVGDRLWVRSPATCAEQVGVCQACYGTDLSTGRLVALGTAVGIIAAQAIGEQGTQLQMRTFHGAGGGTDIEAARSLFNAKATARPLSVGAFVTRVVGIYGAGAVNRRHIEVIFRAMHSGPDQVGIVAKARSSERGLLARAAFVRTTDVLAATAFGDTDDSPAPVGLKDRLMLGLDTGVGRHGARRK